MSARREAGVRRPWRWIALGGVVCLLAWIAMAVGLALGVDRATRIVLVTVAAFATEGLVWLSAFLLGLRVFEARQRLWQALRARFAR
ncbi:hypothetical protein [Luteimonas sp. 3794]|uniref:hypothetical protein n=1 Tax=Luteimonas sp. 3794 TaxID=2817730 RepID=UPI00285D97E3|nr:hypothetical protein [Luteimonas sp. 3794]MDR6991595.1 hypothetical protein [Luteimonas sp. 3794]